MLYLTGQYHFIILAIVKNEVALLRGINVLYHGMFRNTDMKTKVHCAKKKKISLHLR